MLAIADAIQATQPPPRSVARRWMPRIAAVVSVVVVVGVLFGALIDFGGSGDIVGDAQAAVGDGRVLVFQAERRLPGVTVVTLANGHMRPVIVTVEGWRDTANSRQRYRVLHDGVPIDDRTGSDVAVRPVESPGIQTLEAFVTSYRRALQDRTARVNVRALPKGSSTVWLRIPADRSDGAGSLEIELDKKSLIPIAVERGRDRWTIDEFRALRRPRRLPHPTRPTDATSRPVEATRSTLDGARRWLGQSFLWSGKRASGRSLRSTTLHSFVVQTPDHKPVRVRGASIAYGNPRTGIVVNVAPQPLQSFGFANNRSTLSFSPIPPAGAVALTNQGDRWAVQGVKNGTYFTIEGPSRVAVLSTARALDG